MCHEVWCREQCLRGGMCSRMDTTGIGSLTSWHWHALWASAVSIRPGPFVREEGTRPSAPGMIGGTVGRGVAGGVLEFGRARARGARGAIFSGAGGDGG